MPYKLIGAFTILAVLFGGSLGAQDFTTHIGDLFNPVGMVYDKVERLYIAEWGASRVCRYDSNGTRELITDEVGRPSGLAFDPDGNLYIASCDRGVVYIKNENGIPQLFARYFSTPAGLLWDGDSLLVANRDAGEIVRVYANGTKKVLSRGHRMPVDIVKFGDDSLIISCLGGTVERIAPDGSVTILSDQLASPSPGLIRDGKNAVMVPDYGGTTVNRVTLNGRTETVLEGFIIPVGLVRMPDGRVMVADWGRNAASIYSLE